MATSNETRVLVEGRVRADDEVRIVSELKAAERGVPTIP